tara:strand:- start:280 stop:525 length:246 start_codon:yes stop_codon:yes gene_type:complete
MKREKGNTKQDNETISFLKSMGFEETETSLVFSHKMFDGGLFDLSVTRANKFWIMKKIFSKCVEFGEHKKAEEIRKALFRY